MFHRADWPRCITNSTWLARDSHVWRKNSVYWRGTVPWLRFGVRKQPQKEVPDMHGISKQAKPPKMSLNFPAAHGHRTWGGFACRAISRSDTVPQSKTAKATAKRCKAKGSWRRLPKTKTIATRSRAPLPERSHESLGPMKLDKCFPKMSLRSSNWQN